MRASRALRGYNSLEAPIASSEPIPGSTGVREESQADAGSWCQPQGHLRPMRKKVLCSGGPGVGSSCSV